MNGNLTRYCAETSENFMGGPGAGAHAPVKAGLRFSMKARRPSR